MRHHKMRIKYHSFEIIKIGWNNTCRDSKRSSYVEEHLDGSVCNSARCFLDDAINQRTIEKSAIKEIGGNWQKKELKNINL